MASILLAFLWTLTQPRIYESSSSGLVVTAGGDNMGMALAGDNLAKSKATSYKSIAQTRPVADNVIEELDLEENADSLLARISVEVPTDTAEIRVSATAADPAEAQELADAWVTALSEQVRDIESGAPSAEYSSTSEPVVQITPLGKAALPTVPVSPNTKLSLALGGVVGLALGLGYALVRNHLDRRIRSAEAVERLGTAVVGTIPLDDRLAAGRAIVETGLLDHDDRSSHAFSESLRELRTNLSYMDVDHPPRVIVVTSSVPGEGKSSLAGNLAAAIAATGRETVLIDGDLRRPVVTDLFGLPSGAGLTDVLSGNAALEDVMQPYGAIPTLSVLGAGRIPPNPTELLGSKSMKKLLTELAREAIVIVDAPPLLPVTDAAILTKAADGALVAVKAGVTTVDELEKALANLKRVDAHVLGAILNLVPTKGGNSSQYGYYGKYYYSSDSASDRKESSRRMDGAVPVEAPDLPVQDAAAAVFQQPARRAETPAPAVFQQPVPVGSGTHPADYDEMYTDDKESFDDVVTRAQMRHMRRS